MLRPGECLVSLAWCMALSALHDGPAAAQSTAPRWWGGVSVVAQRPSDEGIRPEAIASFDLFSEMPAGPLRLHAYVEAGTSPFRDGVFENLSMVNADAGTALGSGGKGRVQLSELRLLWDASASTTVHAGLMDATGHLDVSRIANDENLFFLGSPFVNNPTIAFPDYALGLAVNGDVGGSERLRLGGVLTSSHGLADNPGRSYGEMLDVAAPGKGLFSGLTLRWSGGGWRASLGGWIDTADRALVDGSGMRNGTAGAFAVAGWGGAEHSASVRLGLADGAVSLARRFGGFAYLWVRGSHAVGTALGRTYVSRAVAEGRDATHLEVFWRRRLVRGLYATLSLQHLRHPELRPAASGLGAHHRIVGLRVSASY